MKDVKIIDKLISYYYWNILILKLLLKRFENKDDFNIIIIITISIIYFYIFENFYFNHKYLNFKFKNR